MVLVVPRLTWGFFPAPYKMRMLLMDLIYPLIRASLDHLMIQPMGLWREIIEALQRPNSLIRTSRRLV
jgi:hypothetical protein